MVESVSYNHRLLNKSDDYDILTRIYTHAFDYETKSRIEIGSKKESHVSAWMCYQAYIPYIAYVYFNFVS